jgi:UDP-N-acetylmuramoyl-L-alanyl-D-glutamate--2,6-diaminopimelate ligase
MENQLPKCRLSPEAAVAALKREGWLKSAGGTPAAHAGTLTTDSRQVAKGDLFLAYQGVLLDGHAHLGKAIEQHAGLLIVEDQAKIPAGTKTAWAEVKSGRGAWAFLAAEAFGNPQRELTCLGVTGTNGKTSTVWMIGELLRAAGVRCLTIGTLGAYFGDHHVPTRHTTPDPDVLYALLADAVKRGVSTMAMEVSSHAIAQEKVLPIRYSAAAFTSFSRDHLDFHPTMEHYFETKMRLFEELLTPDATKIFCDAIEPKPDLSDFEVYGRNIRIKSTGFTGTELEIATKIGVFSGRIPYFARHAIENFVAALLTSKVVTKSLVDASLWKNLRPVPGRLEQVVGKKSGPQVVVDYAHTPDALEKTLQVLRPFTKGQLAVVFGCGGDRDKGKRPEMAKIAEALADRVYVTSDNPRTEKPEAILDDIVRGLDRPDQAKVEVDRAKAIARAIREARSDDMVLIAGKGHETYQIIGKETLPFDDREVARSCL